MYFYKYLKADNLNISMLRHGEVFFASPKELNDIHECKPQFIFSADSEIWSRFIKNILTHICIKLGLSPKAELASKILSLQKDLLYSLLKNKKTKSLNHDTLITQLTDNFGIQVLEKLDLQDAWKAVRALNSYLEHDLNSNLNNSYYMASFSKSATNLTMWGHYGNAEKGFAIIYESVDGNVDIENNIDRFPTSKKLKDDTYLLGMSKRSSAKLIDVVYKNKPVRANGFRGLIPSFIYSEQEYRYDYPEDLLARLNKYDEDDIGSVKFTDWKYEKELRLHLPVYEELDPPLRSIKICQKHIKGIILGSRISSDDKNNVLAACYYLKKTQDTEKELFVFQVKNTPGQYKINVTALGKICALQHNNSPYLEKIKKENHDLNEQLEKITESINAS